MIPEEKVKSILEEVALCLNFKSWTYIQKQLDEPIENYLGILLPLTINGIGNNGEESRSVFIKIPPIERPHLMKSLIHRAFKAEMYTYTTLLPIYQSITNIDTSKLMPECYYGSIKENNEVLVLRDMTCIGYRTRPYGELLFDLEHAVVSLKTLAKFHCLSVILKEKGLDFDPDEMKPYTRFGSVAKYHDMIEHTLQMSTDLFKDSKYYVYLKKLLDNLPYYIEASTSEASYLVYGHGDFSRTNILFKYENDRPIEACLLDFQKSRKISPLEDILLFLLENTDTVLRRKHYQNFLNVYFEELHSNLKSNGLNKIYTMGHLVRDMRVVAPYCIAVCNLGYSLWLGLENTELLKSKNMCSNEDHTNIALLRFKAKVVEMFEDLAHFGYITL